YFARVIFKFSSSQYGTLQVFGTLGALVGNFSIILFLKNIRSKYLIITGLLIQSILLVVFSVAIMPTFGLSSAVLYWVNLTAIFLIEFFNILVNVPINANLQILVPSNYRSRVFSVLEFIAMCMVPISSLIYGFLIDKVSPFLFFLSVNILTLLVSIIFVIIAPEESYESNKHSTTKPTKESISESTSQS
ncbi:MAG: MFS transporter, partial [Fervidobacterium sp.]